MSRDYLDILSRIVSTVEEAVQKESEGINYNINSSDAFTTLIAFLQDDHDQHYIDTFSNDQKIRETNLPRHPRKFPIEIANYQKLRSEIRSNLPKQGMVETRFAIVELIYRICPWIGRNTNDYTKHDKELESFFKLREENPYLEMVS